MCWELETDPGRISAVLRTRIVGIRTVVLADPNGGGLDISAIVGPMTTKKPNSMQQFERRLKKNAQAIGAYRQYELRIHDYPKPYVSVYERCQRKHAGVFFWSFDTEPLTSGDERMQLLACKFDERVQAQVR